MHGHAPRTPEAERSRRWFLNRALLLGGVAAVATMTGCAAGDTTTSPTATATATGGPTGGPPGGGGMGPGASEVKYKDFVGVTTDGKVVEDLYAVHSTGVSTAAIVKAAQAFLAGLSAEQRGETLFDVRADEWLAWSNVDGYDREGVRMGDLTEAQRELGYALLGAALSADGLTQSRNIMKLNAFLGDYNGGGKQTLTEGHYFFTFMGTPSATDPWGFQYEGHHLAINYFVLGDQVVMTPTFMGSEPTSATYQGEQITTFQKETRAGLAMLRALTGEQRAKAVSTSEQKSGVNMKAGAGADNLELPYQGLPGSEMTAEQRQKLLDLVGVYVGYLDDAHAEVRMKEVREHVAKTYFYWIGESGDDSAFYYRVHSPVVLIEYDAQSPLAYGEKAVTRQSGTPTGSPGGGMPGGPMGGDPTQQHIHTIIRTPNGNDYGVDLLKLHLATDH
ncbi:DUF3500 domain-containing protein [Nonomuraea monospora]|uniref:DUF3500 domain-containing protein n=1 Tax=Nonomuraea monospora TaxID=568818 RepID=A0ABP5PR03_9ACTN